MCLYPVLGFIQTCHSRSCLNPKHDKFKSHHVGHFALEPIHGLAVSWDGGAEGGDRFLRKENFICQARFIYLFSLPSMCQFTPTLKTNCQFKEMLKFHRNF